MAKSYNPTDGMASAARRALNWKKDGKRGGTRVGLTRANQLVNKDPLSEDIVLRMHSFFSRHAVDKKAEGFSQGEKGFPSPGRVAWDLWGGDPGESWSKQKRDKIMNDRMNKSVWSGVFFPADEPSKMSLIEEDPMDAPLDIEVVPTDFQVDRQDIYTDTSVTNEVPETPDVVDETPAQEEIVNVAEPEVVEQTDEPVSEDVAPEEPMIEENSVAQDTVTEE